MRLPRLTFLARFTLVTFLSAAVAALVLALVLENAQRRAIERSLTNDAVARIDAIAGPFVDRITASPNPPPQAAFAEVAREADVFNYVTGVRLYDDRGRALYPADAPAQPDAARRAVATEATVTVDRGGAREAYAPLASSDGSRVFVVAVAVSRALMTPSATRDRPIVIGATAGTVALMFVSLVALAAGASRELERRRRESQATFVDTLGVMARTLDLRDPYTAGHSERVAAYSRLIAEELGLDDRTVTVVHSGALLHDLGKIAVPDAVLFKPGKLDAEERHMIQVHPTVGASILGSIASMEDVVPCVLHHHEKINGTGYPQGLAGEKIPLGARIIAVADAFDAMTTDRPYRSGMTTARALAEIVACVDTQFDAACVAAFGRLVERGAIVPPEPSRAGAEFGRKLELESARG